MELRFAPVTGENRSAVLRLRTRPGREGCICDGDLQGYSGEGYRRFLIKRPLRFYGTGAAVSFLTQFGTEMSTSILWKMYKM